MSWRGDLELVGVTGTGPATCVPCAGCLESLQRSPANTNTETSNVKTIKPVKNLGVIRNRDWHNSELIRENYIFHCLVMYRYRASKVSRIRAYTIEFLRCCSTARSARPGIKRDQITLV